ENAPAHAAAAAGHPPAGVPGVAVGGSALLAFVARQTAARGHVAPKPRRALRNRLRAAGVAGVVLVIVALGGPSSGWAKVHDRFNADPTAGTRLNNRLFSITGNGRSEQLRVAWNAARDRPVLGTGAGTFEYEWYEHRPDTL